MPDEQPVSWYERHRRKGRRMADLALKLPVAIVRAHLMVGYRGRVAWTGPGGGVDEIGFAVVGPADPLPAVVLRYVLGDRRVETTVRLTTTRTRFGGRRVWFLCPHDRDGRPCGRRVGVLYRPPDESRFACRTCHNLTYYTACRAHQVERFLQRMADRALPAPFAAVIDWLQDGDGGKCGDRKATPRKGGPSGRPPRRKDRSRG